MKSNREVYNQILWDPAFDEGDFTIGYTERSGIDEIPLAEFDIESIPWGRVQFYKMQGVLVWDRGKRIDKFGDGSIRRSIQKASYDGEITSAGK